MSRPSPEKLAEYVRAGLITVLDGRITLTQQGRAFCEEVALWDDPTPERTHDACSAIDD